MSDVYREYIAATSRGENYSLGQGLSDAFWGAAGSIVKDKAFDTFVPKVSLSGGNYYGAVRGAKPSTLVGTFTGSNARNDLVKESLSLARDVTSSVIGQQANSAPSSNSSGGQSNSSRTPNVVSYGQGMNSFQTTSPAASTKTGGVTTPMTSSTGGSSNSGTSAFTQVVNRVTSVVSGVVTSVRNFFGGLFKP